MQPQCSIVESKAIALSHSVYRPDRYEDEDYEDYEDDDNAFRGRAPLGPPMPRAADYTPEYAPPDRFLHDVDLATLEHAETGLETQDDGTPSLPVILVSAACGLGGGVIGLYLSYIVFGWPTAWVAVATTLGLLFSLGISGALMSAATGARAAPANILFSCGLLLAAALFMGLCLVVGALTATLIFS